MHADEYVVETYQEVLEVMLVRAVHDFLEFLGK